jgi:hypothetical protein
MTVPVQPACPHASAGRSAGGRGAGTAGAALSGGLPQTSQ